MAWNRTGYFAVLSLASIFAACGGDSGNNGKTETDGSSQAETFDDLPNCSRNREGDTVTVLEDRKTYICGNGRWEELGTAYENADDLPNCSDKREGNTAYVVDDNEYLICADGKWEKYSTQPQKQEGDSTEELESSSSDKKFSSSSVERNSTESSSSESKSSSSKESSSSMEEKPISSAERSSSSSESTMVYGTLIDERDGQEYKTVKIGGQIWMAQNLNYDDGFALCPMEDDANCEKYGRLYYNGTSSVEEICPAEWRVPDVSDWEILLQSDGRNISGVALKAASGWPPEGTKFFVEGGGGSFDSVRTAALTGTDLYGFAALPAGSCWPKGVTPDCYVGDDARFYAIGRKGAIKLAFDRNDIVWDEAGRAGYISVRCLKDDGEDDSDVKIDSMPLTTIFDSKEVMLENLTVEGNDKFSIYDARKVCPNEWRLMTSQELEMFVGNLHEYYGDASYITESGCWQTESVANISDGSVRVLLSSCSKGYARCVREMDNSL